MSIACHPNPTFTDVKKMCEIKKMDENAILKIGFNIGESFDSFKQKNHEKKIIVYQLEQLYNSGSQWFDLKSTNETIKKRTKHIDEWLNGSDEIFDYDLDNISFLLKLGYKNIKFKPMQYYEGIEFGTESAKKDIDILFYGSINERRRKYLSQLEKYNIKIISGGSDGVWGEKLTEYIIRSKIIIFY